MNILLKVWMIGAAIALLMWIARHTIVRIVFNAGLIGGALLDVGCQAFIDITSVFRRKRRITELDESEKFYHS